MQKITLYKEQPNAATSVPNIFIDEFMTQANGEYVKIYLYLLRSISTGNPSEEFSLSQAADHFDCTEKDVLRALNYWEKLALLDLEYNGEHQLAGICLPADPSASAAALAGAAMPRAEIQSTGSPSGTSGAGSAAALAGAAAPQSVQTDSRAAGLHYTTSGSASADDWNSAPAAGAPSGCDCAPGTTAALRPAAGSPAAVSGWGSGSKVSSPQPETASKNLTSLFIRTCSQPQAAATAQSGSFSTFCEKEEVQELLFIAEQYLGRTLSHTDLNCIYSWYSEYQFSTELIEYLIETSVAAGHTSLHYMQRIAEDYSARHITTTRQAKELANQNSAVCYAVMKAFGIRGRHLAPSELRYLKNWNEKMGFGIDLISEACSRTIKSIHEPSFGYANSILERWNKQNVHTLEEVALSDAAYQQAQGTYSRTAKKSTAQAANHFANFRQRDNDYDEIQRRLIQNSMQ